MTTPSPTDDDRTARVTGELVTPLVGLRSGGAQFAPGTIVAGRYRISSILGAGGMGEVYRAEDVKLGQAVALKFLPPALAGDPVLLQRLHEEVRVGRQVTHPNVCRIYDIGEWGTAHFVAMEYVDGEDLARLLRRIRRLPHDTAVHIARGMAAGLLAAHAKGIIHRDLKPANVMIDGRGEARISDFGLAIAPEEGEEAALAGTPAYMAPEQLAGAPATVQSDLYALGLVLYEMFTGRRAHAGATPLSPAFDEGPEIVTPSSHVHDLDPAVERVILRCLERDPSRRPRSAREVVEALPGGDPLAAALAAGETPSPRLVAAAGSEGTLAPRLAWSWFAAIVVLIIGWSVLHHAKAVIAHQRVEKPAVVLHDHALDILRAVGLPPHARQSVGYESQADYLVWVTEHVPAASRWPWIEHGPPLLTFWVRDAEVPLTPVAVNPFPTLTDPPLTRGMSTVELDRKGRLYSLRADPKEGTEASAVDWRPLLTAAGFDPAKLTAAPPHAIPPIFADARAAWTGVYPDDARVPIRIEAAMRGGTPVFFEVGGPWADPGAVRRLPFNSSAVFIFVFSLCAVVVAAAIVFAWRNVRARRGDRAGAARLGLFVFAVGVVSFTLLGDHALDLSHELTLVMNALTDTTFWVAMYGVLYLAVEPFVRKRWPERLISWARLISGNFRDPLVGRDVLLGVTAGLCHALLAALSASARMPHGLPLLGFRYGVGAMLASVQSGMFDGLAVIMILVALTMLLRSRTAAAAGLFAIQAAGYLLATHEPSAIPFTMTIAVMLTFVAVRGGLLAFVVTQTVFRWTLFWPLPSSFDDWYFGVGVMSLIGVVALAFYAARIAAGVRPAIRQ
jgi:hypothetical protein